MKTSARIMALLAIAAALLSTAGCNKLKARSELNQGVRAYRNGLSEQAIKHFQQAVMLDENLKYAKLYLATAYAQQFVPGVDSPEMNRVAQQAIEQYKSVLQNDPKDINSLKGIAYLYLQMKKLDDAQEYYKKAIAADPSDPEAYYSVGVIDWSAAYNDTRDRKVKLNLKADDELKNEKVCEEIKAANQARVDDGIKMLQQAMEKRQDYDDAMVYMNLLYLRKADMACNDPAAKAQAKKMSDEFSDKAMEARKKKAEAASKKSNGPNVVMDPKK
ncbi:MAG TPA: tetratricopeptide repeat protein [Candidatus Angelobacter sp.]|nr:tetratricopeptide repeat protein [Candidatus Angelobacter sp.]